MLVIGPGRTLTGQVFLDKYIDHTPKVNSAGEGHYSAHLFSLSHLLWVTGITVDSLWGKKSNTTNCFCFRYKRICSSCPAAKQMGWHGECFFPLRFIMHNENGRRHLYQTHTCVCCINAFLESILAVI